MPSSPPPVLPVRQQASTGMGSQEARSANTRSGRYANTTMHRTCVTSVVVSYCGEWGQHPSLRTVRAFNARDVWQGRLCSLFVIVFAVTASNTFAIYNFSSVCISYIQSWFCVRLPVAWECDIRIYFLSLMTSSPVVMKYTVESTSFFLFLLIASGQCAAPTLRSVYLINKTLAQHSAGLAKKNGVQMFAGMCSFKFLS